MANDLTLSPQEFERLSNNYKRLLKEHLSLKNQYDRLQKENVLLKRTTIRMYIEYESSSHV